MKQTWWSANTLFFCIIMLMLSTSNTQARRVRVATYNVLNGVGATGSVEYASVKSVLQRIDADIVAFQELNASDSNNWATLAIELGYSNRAFGVYGPFSGGLYVGYYSRFPLLSLNTVTSPPGASELTRAPLRAVIGIPGAAKPLALWAMHHKAYIDDANSFRRAIEAVRIKQNMDAYRQKFPLSDDFVFMADCNDYVTRADQQVSFTNLPIGLPSGYALGSDISFPVAYKAFPLDHYSNGGGGMYMLDAYQQGSSDSATFPNAGSRIDYMFASMSLMTSAWSGTVTAEVYNSSMDTGTGGMTKAGSPLPSGTSTSASDHYPVFADLFLAEASVTNLIIQPATSVLFQRLEGGQIQPSFQTFSLSNASMGNIHWTAISGESWFTTVQTGGVLAAQSSTSIVVSLTGALANLPAGTYGGTLFVADLDNKQMFYRHIELLADSACAMSVSYLNLVRNSGFETQGVSVAVARYWNQNDPDYLGGNWGNASRQNWSPHSGSWIGTIRGTSAGTGEPYGGFWQRLPINPGREYSFGGWFKADASWVAGGKILICRYFDSNIVEQTYFTSNLGQISTNWSFIRFKSLAPTNAVWIQSGVEAFEMGTSGALWIDDLQAEQVSLTGTILHSGHNTGTLWFTFYNGVTCSVAKSLEFLLPGQQSDFYLSGIPSFTCQTMRVFMDVDGDGIQSAWEASQTINCLNLPTYNYTLWLSDPDFDSDGLTDYQELFVYMTLPDNPDTDADGITDGDEIANGMSPLDPWGIETLSEPIVGPSPELVLTWESVSGRLYSISRFANLQSPSALVSNNIIATPPINESTVSVSDASFAIYAVGLMTNNPLISIAGGLVAYYPFNGNATDESTNSNNGLVMGAVLTTDRFSMPNKAYRFATNAIINCGNSPVFDFHGSNFTINIRYFSENWAVAGSVAGLISKRDSFGGLDWQLANVKDSSQMTFWGGPSMVLLNSPSSATGIWSMVTVVRSGNLWSMYMDGILRDEHQTNIVFGTGDSVRIGTLGLNENGNTFIGKLDDVRIYNRALSSNEVWLLNYLAE